MSKNTILGAAALGTIAAAIACGAQPSHVEEPQPSAKPSAQAPVTSEPSAEPLPEPVSSAGPDASAAPDTGKKPPPPPSGRPAIMMGPSKKIASTFGSTPGAILKLKTSMGDFSLKIGEYALHSGTNITFEVGGKTRGKAPVIGDVIHLTLQMGEETRMSEVDSGGPPFVVIVPSKKSLNLAVGIMQLDEMGQETTKVRDWTIYAPVRFDAGLSQVVFELTHLGPSVMYATNMEPTAKPAEKPAE